MPPPSGSNSSDDPAAPAGPPDTVLMTVTLASATPAAAAAQLGIPEQAIDPGFGVIAIDPDRQLFAVRVARSAAPAARPGAQFRGPFADARIGLPPKKPESE